MTKHDTSTSRRPAAPSPEQVSAEVVRRSFEASYLKVQYEFVQFFTEHVVDSARGFGHDLEQMVVMAVLGQRMLQTALAGQEADMTNQGRVSMTASRIADVTGLPRETVRRKLMLLRKRGWIAHDPRHGWHVLAAPDGTSPARDAFTDFEARFQKRLARLYVRLAAIVQNASEATVDGGRPPPPGAFSRGMGEVTGKAG